jgi:thiol-disulfide isomerase/thioredoxin
VHGRSEAVTFTVVVVSVMVAGGLLLRQNQELRRLLSGPPKVIVEGQLIGPLGLGEYRWDSNRATLVIALRSGCPYCEASMGLYGRISELWKGHALEAYPLVLYPDSTKEVNAEIRDLRQLTNVDYVRMGVGSTPTLLLIDSQGRVLRKWTGQLTSQTEEGFLSTVRSRSAGLQDR